MENGEVTCQQLVGDIKHTSKNTTFFDMCCYDFSQGWKSLYNTLVYMINTQYVILIDFP